MVTAAESPRALNEPVGIQAFVLDEDVRDIRGWEAWA